MDGAGFPSARRDTTALANIADLPRDARLLAVSPGTGPLLRRVLEPLRPDVTFADDAAELGRDGYLYVGGPAMHRDLDDARRRGLDQAALILPEASTSYYDFWSLPVERIHATDDGGPQIAAPAFEDYVASLGDFFGHYRQGVYHHQGQRYQPWRRIAEHDKKSRLEAAIGVLHEQRSRETLLAVLAEPPEAMWRRWLGQVCGGLEYFDCVTLDPGAVVLNAGVHGGGEIPYFMAAIGEAGRIVNVDPLGDAYLAPYVRTAVDAFAGDCRFVAAALHDGETTVDLPVENGGMAAGNSIGKPIPGTTMRRFPARSVNAIAAELALERLDLIKMDVEGAEPRALEGAMRTIERLRPQLAISIYHEPDHFLDILGYLARTLAGYRFYVRNYHFIANETILYAVPVERQTKPASQGIEIALV